MTRASRSPSLLIVAGLFLFGCGGVSTSPDAGGGAGGSSAGAGGRGGATGSAGRGGAGGSGGAAGAAGSGGVAGTGGTAGAAGSAGTGGTAGAAGTGGAAGVGGRGGSGGAAGTGGAAGAAGTGGAAGVGGRGGSGGTAGTAGGAGGSGGAAGAGGTSGGAGGTAGAAGVGGRGGAGGSGGTAGSTAGNTAGSGGGAGSGGTGGTGGTAGTAGAGGGGAGTGGSVAAPSITATSYAVVAHGMDLTITGTRLTGATALTIGGTAHVPTVVSDTQASVHVADATPIGPQQIVITTAGGSSTPFGVTVIHLVINELDADQASVDTAEFVEISAGVANVSLAGYSLVLWNGASDSAYYAIDLNATTNAAGLVIAGNTAPTLTFPDNTLQNGTDGAGLYAAQASLFPNGSLVTAARLLDAVVYDTGDIDDVGLLDALLGAGPGRVQIDEGGATATPETFSIQRCGSARLDGRVFVVAPPTANAVNTACN